MSTSKKYIGIAVAIALIGLVLVGYGCRKAGSEAEKTAADSIQLCIQCGQIKGSALCCKPGQTMCSSCGLVKGSPGCCKIPKGAKTAVICADCGQIKGGVLCCQPNQTKCPKCGLVKGSPGCCLIPK